jgi:hypothetical protein
VGCREATYVVKKTFHDIGSAQFPTLSMTDYAKREVLVR